MKFWPYLLIVFSVLTSCSIKGPMGPAGEDGTTTIIYQSGGVITSDTTWSGTVNVTGNIVVPSGVTLSIADGTVVNFYQATITVEGTIDAIGSISKNISFKTPLIEGGVQIMLYTTASAIFKNVFFNGENCDPGIAIENYSSGLCKFNNCDFSNSSINISGIGHTTTISNSRLKDTRIINYGSGSGVCSIYNTDSTGYEYSPVFDNGGYPTFAINLINCYIADNNGAIGATLSTAVPDDSNFPQQYIGVTSVIAPRATPNFP